MDAFPGHFILKSKCGKSKLFSPLLVGKILGFTSEESRQLEVILATDLILLV